MFCSPAISHLPSRGTPPQHRQARPAWYRFPGLFALLATSALLACAPAVDGGTSGRQASVNCPPRQALAGQVAEDNLRLRSRPTTTADSTVLRYLMQGTHLRLEAYLPQGEGGDTHDWFRVTLDDGTSGFVAAAFVEITRCREADPGEPPSPPEPTAAGRLTRLVQALGARCAGIGARCGLAVRDLATGEEASYQGDEGFISASAAKLIWVTLALQQGVPPAQLDGPARAIFSYSDNEAPGTTIDLARARSGTSGYDFVNHFYHDVLGMSARSFFCKWKTAESERATSFPTCSGAAPVNGLAGWYNQDRDNFHTASDGIRFLDALWTNEDAHGEPLLTDAGRRALLDWTALTPRWSHKYFPEAGPGAPLLYHKPGRLDADDQHTYRLPHRPFGETFSPYSVVTDLAIVELPDGHAYALAYLLDYGDFYDEIRLAMFMSCMIYHTILGDLGTDAARLEETCRPTLLP